MQKKIKQPKYSETIVLTATQQQVAEFLEKNSKRASSMCKILMLLMDDPELSKEDVYLKTWASAATFRALKQKGFIDIIKEEIYREASPEIHGNIKKVTPTTQQQECINTVMSQFQSNNKKTVLLRGVTGSGKTEVYMQITERMMAMGKSVIVLIPEISLTPQMVANFRGRFGDSIAILNSRLSAGERYDAWRSIKRGNARVIIGARSAVFAPTQNLGAIIIDEEHEDSYKSETNPRYNAIEIAQLRTESEDAVLLLGSATPDVVHYSRANNGEYVKLLMEKRVGVGFPNIAVCDMRKELEAGNRTMFSKPLYHKLLEISDSDGQGILLLNRRGFAEHVSCRSCGYVYKCTHCNISLTYHQNNNLLKCHYCGYARYMSPLCPQCGSKYIRAFGRGTQRLESEIEKMFPKLSVIRMDADTTVAKGSHHNILNQFGQKKFKLLIGTQMVAKGLDFENVILVGLIAPDVTLNMPEYKSAERVFRLISQASGRAGRGEKEGEVIVQSYQPEHYAVRTAAENDYDRFYDEEMKSRQENCYPPFCKMLRLLYASASEGKAMDEALNAKRIIEGMEKSTIIEIQASSAPIERIHDKFRWHVIVKYDADDKDTEKSLHDTVNQIMDINDFANVHIAVDFSPQSLL